LNKSITLITSDFRNSHTVKNSDVLMLGANAFENKAADVIYNNLRWDFQNKGFNVDVAAVKYYEPPNSTEEADIKFVPGGDIRDIYLAYCEIIEPRSPLKEYEIITPQHFENLDKYGVIFIESNYGSSYIILDIGIMACPYYTNSDELDTWLRNPANKPVFFYQRCRPSELLITSDLSVLYWKAIYLKNNFFKDIDLSDSIMYAHGNNTWLPGTFLNTKSTVFLGVELNIFNRGVPAYMGYDFFRYMLGLNPSDITITPKGARDAYTQVLEDCSSVSSASNLKMATSLPSGDDVYLPGNVEVIVQEE